MRDLFAPIAAMLLTGCSTPEQRQHDEIMSRIDKQVHLPNGAGPLNDYIRGYTTGGHDQVVGIYALPSVVREAAKDRCTELTADGRGKPMPCYSPLLLAAKPGDHVWVSRTGDMMFNSLHGCEVISVAYKVSEGRFEEVSCMGQRLER